jgi:maleate isomerase
VKQDAAAKVGTPENYNTMIDDLDNAARSVALPGPKLIVFSCTSGSFFKGKGWDLELAGRMEAAAGIPALTTSTAAREAFAALGAKTLFMVTPYPDSVNATEVRFFKDNGLDIVDHITFNCAASRDIGAITPERIKETVLGRRADIGKCDALFISCTALRAIDAVEALEAELGLPVVTSNSATIWAALRRLGVDTASVPAGRLFRLPAPGERSRVA